MDTKIKRWLLLLFVAVLTGCVSRTKVFAAVNTSTDSYAEDGYDDSAAGDYGKPGQKVSIKDDDPFTYVLLADGTIEISRCEREVSGEIIIPDMVDGKKVTSIGKSAFFHCKMKAVTIPEGVAKISEEAFFVCQQLEQVVLPKSIVSIEKSAFSSCNKLKSIIIPEGITKISKGAFSGCGRLEQVFLPKNIVSIEDSAFSSCVSLREIAFPSALKSIGDRAFYAAGLEQVEIPAEKIGKAAFSDCKNLESVKILKKMEKIEENIFCKCESLINVSLPSGIKEIGTGAFSYCTSLEGIDLPSGVTKIGAYAFRSCISLKSIKIPSGAKTIDEEAFFLCESLSKVTFPSSVAVIGDSAFASCKSLKNIKLPSGLKQLGYTRFNEGHVFAETGLTSIVIPKNVEKIGVECFYKTKMKTITIHSKKSNFFNAFLRMDTTKLTLKVPASKLKEYKDYFGSMPNYDFTHNIKVRFVAL